MLLRSTLLACALSAASLAHADEVKQLKLNDLSGGSRLQFATAERVYRAEIVDSTTGEARLAASTDGVKFSQPITVFLLGATQGRAPEAGGQMLVKMNQLQTGLRLELGVGSLDASQRFVTEQIQDIRVE